MMNTNYAVYVIDAGVFTVRIAKRTMAEAESWFRTTYPGRVIVDIYEV